MQTLVHQVFEEMPKIDDAKLYTHHMQHSKLTAM